MIQENSFPKEINFLSKKTLFKSPFKLSLSSFLKGAGLAIFLIFILPLVFIQVKAILEKNPYKNDQAVAAETNFERVMETKDMKVADPLDTNFSLVIPRINLNSKVILDVPVGEKDVYERVLDMGIAHAQGSFYPGGKAGRSGTIFLFGHSSVSLDKADKIIPVFYRLGSLSAGDGKTPGDLITAVFKGQQYHYQVVEKSVISPDNLSYLQPQEGKEKLILQTCWPFGTNLKRLVIVAEKV